MSTTPSIRVIPAGPGDAPLILSFIRELAHYERRLDQVVATREQIEATLFAERPAAEVLIAYQENEAVGFALFFQNYSTFLGRPGLYLEDLFVRPPARGRGVGRALLSRLASIAKERGCGRVEWAVLDWNETAIAFYKRLGAETLSDWRILRLAGDALDRLASDGQDSEEKP